MATSASVRISENKKTLVNLYVHSDGYAYGLGRKLATILSDGKMVNGIRFDPSGMPKLGSQFNGGGCLAASIIAMLKKEPGEVYISFGKDDCDHHYDIVIKKRSISIILDGKMFYESKISSEQSIIS